MKVCRTKSELNQVLDPLRGKGLSMGFVPTMGALHEGHLSLLRQASQDNDLCIASIFVNPTQFNDPGDLERYPRTPEQDLALLENMETAVVFMPGVREMYPSPDRRVFDFKGLDRRMEGAQRPGHFNGVAQIVSKLFEAVRPQRAYFGQKDFQQLAIVRLLTEQLDLDLEILACPIIREADGLAMSSRNLRLSPEARESAPYIYRCLQEARELSARRGPQEIIAHVQDAFRRRREFQLEYYEIVDEISLRPVHSWEEKGRKIACIAAMLDDIRLIDNLFFD
jgi:pantoate--beta-alanine ligase